MDFETLFNTYMPRKYNPITNYNKPSYKKNNTDNYPSIPKNDIDLNNAELTVDEINNNDAISGSVLAKELPLLENTNQNNIDWENSTDKHMILDSQVYVESKNDPYAIGTSGEVGLGQFMPGTWDMAKKLGWVTQDAVRSDPVENINAQTKMMEWLFQRAAVRSGTSELDRLERALAGYNAGIGNLQKAISKAEDAGTPEAWKDFLPRPEITKKYIEDIKNNVLKYKIKNTYIPVYRRTFT